MLINPKERAFEAAGSVIQVGDGYILYVDGGKEEAAEKDKFHFKDMQRITVIRDRTKINSTRAGDARKPALGGRLGSTHKTKGIVS